MISPFKVDIDIETIDRTLNKVRDAVWPRKFGDGGWNLGVSYEFMHMFAAHWCNGFDWREAQAGLNAWPQYTDVIDGVIIHFYHVKGEGSSPRPLLLTHGWPGSIYEFVHLIGPLTQPSAYGGHAGDAFTVVIPSLPGHGFSGLPLDRVIGPVTTAEMWKELMVGRLGYSRFAVQGGDFGAVVSICLADRYQDQVVAMHLNTLPIAMRPVEDLNGEETAFLAEVTDFLQTEFDYFNIQKQKTNTVSFALCDNPLGTAAWILEKFYSWSDHGGNLLNSFSLDQLCTNVSIYAFTKTIETSIRMYNGLWIELGGAFRPVHRIEVPTGAALFPKEVRPANPPRSWAELQYNIKRWTVMPKGGHFAALEQPELFLADVRDFFRDYL